MMDTSSDETTSMETEMFEYNIDNIIDDEYYFQDYEKVQNCSSIVYKYL
jgi:hypothetical protein